MANIVQPANIGVTRAGRHQERDIFMKTRKMRWKIASRASFKCETREGPTLPSLESKAEGHN